MAILSYAGSFLVTAFGDTVSNTLGKAFDTVSPTSSFTNAVICDEKTQRHRILMLEQIEVFATDDASQVPLLVNSIAESTTVVSGLKRILLSGGYDASMFNPAIKSLSRTYNLLCLQTISPFEDVLRKMHQEEYGIASELASRYGIDADLVYEYQWNATKAKLCPLEVLNKIRNLHFIVNECLTFVPKKADLICKLFEIGITKTENKDHCLQNEKCNVCCRSAHLLQYIIIVFLIFIE